MGFSAYSLSGSYLGHKCNPRVFCRFYSMNKSKYLEINKPRNQSVCIYHARIICRWLLFISHASSTNPLFPKTITWRHFLSQWISPRVNNACLIKWPEKEIAVILNDISIGFNWSMSCVTWSVFNLRDPFQFAQFRANYNWFLLNGTWLI